MPINTTITYVSWGAGRGRDTTVDVGDGGEKGEGGWGEGDEPHRFTLQSMLTAPFFEEDGSGEEGQGHGRMGERRDY